MDNWIKRETRQTSKSYRGAILLIILALIAITLCLYRYSDQTRGYLAQIGIGPSATDLVNEQDITIIVRQTLNDYRLSHIEIEKVSLNHDNHRADYPVFKTLWPDKFPFIWFNTSVKAQTVGFKNFAIESTEKENGEKLLLFFINPQTLDTLGEVLLLSSRQTQPEISSIAFLFSDFADYKIEDALELVWLDIPFGFILKPDQIPGEKLTKALLSSRGQCLLNVPADKESWDLILKAHRLAKNITNIDLSPGNIHSILEAFPVLNGFYFSTKSDSPPDRELIRLIIEQAEFYRLTYIKFGNNPVYADSLAYLKGLSIRELNSAVNLSISGRQEIKTDLIKAAGDFSKSNKGIYIVRSDKNTVKTIKEIQELFERLNIVQSKPLRIATSTEDL